MSARTDRFLSEAWRFAAIGVLATVVSFTLFNLLVHGFGIVDAPLNRHAVTGYVLANVVGMAISFRGTKDWVFRERRVRHADGGVTAFVVINVVTMLIPMACLAFSRHVLDRTDAFSDNLAANVIGLALGFVARFWLFRYTVFVRTVELPAQPRVHRSGQE
ncbi:GtrA family protein [Nocardioides rotundus]|uniref:GtrA family protein n=1 Tax=Nocardioides rotundus TaxID=1774216 RepID=UPI001CBF28F0|nr:GtrA family protein [Nocardioides rotundus]UAL28663.1 GtrA family protein [Nocardioides rotundus]